GPRRDAGSAANKGDAPPIPTAREAVAGSLPLPAQAPACLLPSALRSLRWRPCPSRVFSLSGHTWLGSFPHRWLCWPSSKLPLSYHPDAAQFPQVLLDKTSGDQAQQNYGQHRQGIIAGPIEQGRRLAPGAAPEKTPGRQQQQIDSFPKNQQLLEEREPARGHMQYHQGKDQA